VVPTQLYDLLRHGQPCPSSLRAIVVGGAALDEGLHARALQLGWPVLRSYGMTEAASQVATELSPGSAVDGWLPLLDHFEARTDEHGVLELRGPSLLTGWMIFENDGTARWEDPKRNGWFRTSDRVELRGRELRVLGRVDDLVKIRGELVDVGALEIALQARVTQGRVAVYRLPDERNGTALRVVAENTAALNQARALRDEIFPPYARPEEFVQGPVEVTALGKTIRCCANIPVPPGA
jgi:O-succinylbenzoic acid--CoA ligase